MPAVLWQAACCTGPSGSSSVSSARLFLSPRLLPLWTASSAESPTLRPGLFQHHVVSEDIKTHSYPEFKRDGKYLV